MVQRPDSPHSFPGLYLNALPEQPFLDDSIVLMTTQWRSSSDVLAVDLSSKSLRRLRPEGAKGSLSLLAVGNGAPQTAIQSPEPICNLDFMCLLQVHPMHVCRQAFTS